MPMFRFILFAVAGLWAFGAPEAGAQELEVVAKEGDYFEYYDAQGRQYKRFKLGWNIWQWGYCKKLLAVKKDQSLLYYNPQGEKFREIKVLDEEGYFSVTGVNDRCEVSVRTKDRILTYNYAGEEINSRPRQ